MQSCRLFSVIGCLTFLAGCNTEYVYVVPNVPAELRAPVSVPVRPAQTLRDVGIILSDHVEALETANGRIVSIDCILTAAESGSDAPC
jgi:hypothetical protein